MKEPAICIFWYDFLNWLLDRTEKFPKRVRFTIVQRIDNLALDILDALVMASYSPKETKLEILQKANLQLERLRILLRLSCRRHYLNPTSFEYAMKQMDEGGKMLGGWIKERQKS